MQNIIIEILKLFLLVATFGIIIKKILDPRIAFAIGGLIMILLSQNWETFFETANKLKFLIVPGAIISLSFGFSEILKTENYGVDTVNFIGLRVYSQKKNLGRASIILAILTTWIISFALLSANAACAMIAPIFFPILQKFGLPANVAATGIICGAWGPIMNPGDINCNQINSVLVEMKLAELQPILEHSIPSVLSLLTIIIILILLNKRRISKYHTKAESINDLELKKNYRMRRAIIPFIPFIALALIVFLVRMRLLSITTKPQVIISLLLGCLLAIYFSKNQTKRILTIKFFRGCWKGLFEVVLLLIASKLFIAGILSGDGKIAIANLLKESGNIQIPLAIIATFVFAGLTGSGDAIVTSIIQLVVPFLGPTIASFASSSIWFAGEMGRCISPVSAATVTVAKIASIDPNKIALKTVLPVTLGLMVAVLTLLLIKTYF